jgi:D-sedoheptulose 7-phosphate isomerase
MTFPEYLKYFVQTLQNLDTAEVDRFMDLLVDCYENDRSVYIIGNGGSAANASHLATDLAKGSLRSMQQTKRLRAMSLTDNVGILTAYGNDEGYASIFEQQLRSYAKPGDVVIAISGSGNSPNVIAAIEWANANGLTTVGVTGFGGGKLRQMAQYPVHVPLNDMCTSESVHSFIFHYIAIELPRRMYKNEAQPAAAAAA